MENAGMTSDESANKTKPAVSTKNSVAESFAIEKEAEKQEKELIILQQIKLEDLEQERLKVKKTEAKKTTTKKTTTKAVKAAEVVKEDVKAVEAEVETKEAEVKETAKKEVEVKPVEEKETKTTKATKTTKTTKVVAKNTSEKIVLQVNGRDDLAMDSLIDRVKAAYIEEGNKADSIQNIEVYIKLEENMAYYVIDGYASGISLY